ncbi:hypothetical protein ABIA38_001603 [Embleya sp. AB8]
MYLLPAGTLFADLGYRQVFEHLCAGLAVPAPAGPSGSTLRQARRRLGATPSKALFDLLRGPVATTATRWRGMPVVAVDGTLPPVPDTAANLAVFVKQRCNSGTGGHPRLRLATLVACGTRSVVGAVFGPATTGELEYAGRLTGDLRMGMLLLGDRNFAASVLLNGFAAIGAHLPVRCKSGRRLVPVARCGGGSFLARMGALTVRVIDAEISITTSRGAHTGHYRLLTTLTDPSAHPAGELVRLHHERREVRLPVGSALPGARSGLAAQPAGARRGRCGNRPAGGVGGGRPVR